LKVLLIDNFDSFTFNLGYLLESLDAEVKVVRNNNVSKSDLNWCDKIVLSPGPGIPSDAKGMNEVISLMYSEKPILGVCLGMQALAEFFGDSIYNLNKVFHGVQKCIHIKDESNLFKGMGPIQEVALYHSWAVQLKEDSCFLPLAFSEDKVLMAIKHSDLPLFGIQFHPESILTRNGREMIENFLKL